MTIKIEIPCEGDMIHLVMRQAETADSRALISLLQELERELDYLVISGDMSVEQQEALLYQYQQSWNSLYLVVEADGQLVGIASLAGEQHPLLAHRATLGIALLEDYWGYGIGSVLIEELLEFAAHSQIEMITLEVVSENERAISLYQKYQFKEVGCFSNYIKTKCHCFDAILMERHIETMENEQMSDKGCIE